MSQEIAARGQDDAEPLKRRWEKIQHPCCWPHHILETAPKKPPFRSIQPLVLAEFFLRVGFEDEWTQTDRAQAR